MGVYKWQEVIRIGEWQIDSFDSKFEKELEKGVLSHCEFHPKEKVEYVVPKKYSPDFKWTDSKGFTYLIEAKGRFEDNYESSKYKHIREQLS